MNDNRMNCRFSDLLSETSAGFLIPSQDADTAHDLDKQRKIVYTMATCHSLRVVDDELLGDPLDVKMFQFTGWSYEEGGGRVSEQTNPKYDTIAPSVAKPPFPVYPNNHQPNNSNVSSLLPFFCTDQRSVAKSVLLQDSLELGVLRNFEFVSQLRRASVVVRQFGDNGVNVFVKGAPESIRDICVPESRKSMIFLRLRCIITQ